MGVEWPKPLTRSSSGPRRQYHACSSRLLPMIQISDREYRPLDRVSALTQNGNSLSSPILTKHQLRKGDRHTLSTAVRMLFPVNQKKIPAKSLRLARTNWSKPI